jgi:hypothetical protein
MIQNPQDVEVEKSAKTQDQGAICLSECASDFIAPLPKTVLPTNKRKKLKIDSFSDGLRDAGKRYFLVMLRDHLKRSLSTAESVCLHQSENQEDFTVHKTTDFHKALSQWKRRPPTVNYAESSSLLLFKCKIIWNQGHTVIKWI